MSDESNDILISAYLDGELSADERAKVDALLADSADAQQTLEELKAIRASLQNLPRYRLGPNFAQSVLDRAEEQLPAGNVQQPAKVESAPMPGRMPASVFRSWRGYAWSAIAIAAAVMILVATRSPNGPAEKEVARGPEAAEAPAAQLALKKAPQSTVAENQPAVTRLAEESRPGTRFRGADGDRPSATDTAGMAAETRGGVGGGGAPGAPAFPPAPATPPAEKIASDQIDFGAHMEGQKNVSGVVDTTKLAATTDVSRSESLYDPAQAGKDRLLVVRCEITPDAAQRAAFDRVLLRNDIKFVNEPSKDEGAKAGGGAANASAADRLEKSAESTSHDDREQPHGQVAVQNFQYVYVEARPEQIAATIEEMNRAKDVFISVSAEESPTDEALATVNGKADGGEIAKQQSAADDKSGNRRLEDKSLTVNGAAPSETMQKKLGEKDAAAYAAQSSRNAEPVIVGGLKAEANRKPMGAAEASLREKEASETVHAPGRAQRLSSLEDLAEFKKNNEYKLEVRDKSSDAPLDLRRDAGGGQGGAIGGGGRFGGANSFGRSNAAAAPAAQAAPMAAPAAPESGLAANQGLGGTAPGGARQNKAVEELKSDNFGDRIVRGARASSEQPPLASTPPQSSSAPALQRALFVLRQVDTPAAAKALPVAPAAPAENR
jgi:negative regulator of sigma E activity